MFVNGTVLTMRMMFVAAVLWSAAVYADFEKGMQYYERGEFREAYEAFHDAAKYGDKLAQRNLGAMYYRGEFVDKDAVKSYAWFAVSAEREDADGTPLHEKLYTTFSHEQRDLADIELEKVSAQYSDTAVESRLMPAYLGVSPQYDRLKGMRRIVPKYPRSMASTRQSTGWVDIIYTVDERGLTRDHLVYFSSAELFTKAAIKALRAWQYEPARIDGRPVAINGVKMRFSFRSGKTDDRRIIRYINEVGEQAKSGDSTDKLVYAMVLDVLPTFLDDASGFDNPNEWYRQSAQAGNAAANYFLGRNIHYGNRCDADSDKSEGWLLRAASLNVVDAQYMLARELMSGALFEQDVEKARYWLEKAAGKHEPAKMHYAWLLATSSDDGFRDGKKAALYLADVSEDYLDRQTYFQVSAAVAAENGDFKAALKWQAQAIKDAKILDLPLQVLSDQRESYENNVPWRGTL